MGHLNYALITGASSGIGLELARIFAADGIPLLLVARRTAKLEEIQAELSSQVDVKLFTCDVGNAEARLTLLNFIDEQGLAIDYLVNNAGIGQYGNVADADWSGTDAMLQLNMVGLSHLCRSLLPAMIKRGFGKVLNVASTAAFQPGPGMAGYFASKAYVLSYSEALAYELKGTGVSATCLCPGATKTEFFETAKMTDSKLAKENTLASSKDVAIQGYQAMNKGEPLTVHGLLNRFLIFASRFGTRAMTTAIAAAILKQR